MELIVADMHTYQAEYYRKGLQVTLFDKELLQELSYKHLIEFLYFDYSKSRKDPYEPIIKYITKELVISHGRTTLDSTGIYQETFNCSTLQTEFCNTFGSTTMRDYEVTIFKMNHKCFLESKKDYLKIVRPNKNFKIDIDKYDEKLWYTYVVFHKKGERLDPIMAMGPVGRFLCSDDKTIFMRDFDKGSKLVNSLNVYDYQKLCYNDTVNINIERLTGTQFGIKYLDKILSM